jgi:hypothetical protein
MLAEKIYDFIQLSGEVSMREISVRLSRNVSIKEIWLVIYDLESQKLVGDPSWGGCRSLGLELSLQNHDVNGAKGN